MEKRILVFGSYVTDLCGRTDTLPKAGETVKGHYFKMGPGGKGSNQAIAAKRAGDNVTFVTKLGNDALGKEALAFYKEEQLDTASIFIDEEQQTGAALIIVDETTAQNQIVVVSGACGNFTEADMPAILKQVESADILLLQLETNLEPVQAVLRHAKKQGVFTVLNPAPAQHLTKEDYRCVDVITPNETEAEFLTGVAVTDAASAASAAQKLMDSGVGKVVITLGGNGAYACDGHTDKLFNIVNCGPAADTTGAGDAFTGGFTAALARGTGFFDAVLYGSCVAGLAVTRNGTAPAMPYRDEIDRVFDAEKKK